MALCQGFFVVQLTGDHSQLKPAICCKFEPPPCGKQQGSSRPDGRVGPGLLSGQSDPILAQFCLPLGTQRVAEWRERKPRDYSFSLTGASGERTHGFCRVAWTQDAGDQTLPQVMCILSTCAYFDAFSQVLDVCEDLLGQVPPDAPVILPDFHPLSSFLKELACKCPALPSPLSSFRVQESSFTLPGDTGNGSWNAGVPVASILNYLSPLAVLDILSAVLLERRCLFVASSLGTLSRSVHAIAALIYPFRWQHIFLPVLPVGLLDYLQAPMPWIAGLPRQMVPLLAKIALEDAVVINLDTGKVRMSPQDRHSADRFPWREQMDERLHQVLEAMDTSGRDGETVASVLLSSVMRDFFLRLLGSYRCFCNPVQSAASPAPLFGSDRTRRKLSNAGDLDLGLMEGNMWFDHNSFSRSHRSKRARRLVSSMRDSQIYEVFIRERLRLTADGCMTASTDDSFEADVAALSKGLNFSSRSRLALSRLQSNAGQLVDHLKNIHTDILTSSGSKQQQTPGRNSSSSGILRRRTADEDHHTPGSLAAKVNGAGRRVGSVAASMGDRFRKQADALGEIVRPGTARRAERTVSSPPEGLPQWGHSTGPAFFDSRATGYPEGHADQEGLPTLSRVKTEPPGHDECQGACTVDTPPLAVSDRSTFEHPFRLPRSTNGEELPDAEEDTVGTGSAVNSEATTPAARGTEYQAESLDALFDGANLDTGRGGYPDLQSLRGLLGAAGEDEDPFMALAASSGTDDAPPPPPPALAAEPPSASFSLLDL